MPENEALSFIFGGNTGLTQEELKKRRARVAAELARQHPFPKNIGEGLTYLGNSIGDVGLEWRLRQAEAEALKRQQGIVGGAPPESDGSNPIARPSDRPVVTVAPPPAAAPAAAPAARPVRTVPVRPSVAPSTETAAPPPALVDPKTPVTVDTGDPDAPVVAPRIEMVNPPPDTAPPPPVETAPDTDSPPPFFEGRPNNQVSQSHPALAVPHLGGPRFSPPPTRAEQMSQQMRQPVPVPQASPDAFGGRFGGDQLRAMEGEGEPVPYFDESASLPRGVAQREPLRRTDRLPLPSQPEFAEEGSPFNSMDAAAPELPSAPPPIGRAVPTPRPRPDVEGGLNTLDRQSAAPAPQQVTDGGYNSIDAQAGFRRPTPGYMQDAIARATPDPDRQAYLGSLAGSEARSAREVSPTGAAGPFQFTRGTGRQYGIPGNRRMDLDASAAAANRLTDDNVAAFERINGRPPSPAEMAVMHQQGGVTGARMIAGTGNAPAHNLSVNRVDPNASPQQATARIKEYYGMPDEPPGGGGAAPTQTVSQPPRPATMIGGGQPQDPRAAIVQALVDQQGGPDEASRSYTNPSGGGQQNPILADLTGPQATQTGASPTAGRSTSTSAASGNLPITVSDISPIPIAQRGGSMGAPPVSSDMQRGPAVPQAPGVDPRANEPIPDTVQPPPLVPPGPRPEPPTRLDPTPAERYWRAVERDPYASDTTKAHAKEVIAREAHIREWKQKQVDDNYNYLRGRHDHDTDEYNKLVRAAPKEALEQLAIRLKIAKDQADLRNQPLVSAKMQADLDKVLQELGGFETVTEGGRTYQRRKSTPNAPFERPPGLPDTPKDLTEAQTTLLGHYTKGSLALDQLRRIPNYDKLLAEGLRDELAGRVPYVNNSLLSEQYRAVRIAASNLITAHLRRTSGAVIGAQEMSQHMNDIIPRYGDDPLTMRNKREQQDAIVTSMYIGLGETGQKYAKQYDTDRREQRTKAQEKISAEMAGVPNPVPGQIYKKGNKRRLLTLDGWEDLN